MLKIIFLQVFSLVIITSVVCSKFEPVNHVSSTPKESLQKDLNDFLNLIPVESIRNLTKFFYANDEAMHESYDYLREKGFQLVVENLSKFTLVKKFTTFLNDSGVNLADLAKRIEAIVLTSDELKSIDGNCSK